MCSLPRRDFSRTFNKIFITRAVHIKRETTHSYLSTTCALELSASLLFIIKFNLVEFSVRISGRARKILLYLLCSTHPYHPSTHSAISTRLAILVHVFNCKLMSQITATRHVSVYCQVRDPRELLLRSFF